MRIRGAGNKVDANQAVIIATLKHVGATVQSLSAVGCGCPDLLVCFRRKMYLMEIKSDEGELTQAEIKWLNAWGCDVCIVRDPEQALSAIGALK